MLKKPTVDKPNTPEAKDPKPQQTPTVTRLSDEDMVIEKIKEMRTKFGYDPMVKEMTQELGWGTKRMNNVLNELVDQGRIEKKKDERDRRIVRLIVKDG